MQKTNAMLLVNSAFIPQPGRENKSTCALVTLSNWEWFQKWANAPLKKRGDDYDEIKKTIGEKCIERACELYPQIRNHIDYVEIG